MNMQTGQSFLKLNQRRIRSEHIAYVPDCIDFYITPTDSYQSYMSEKHSSTPPPKSSLGMNVGSSSLQTGSFIRD